MSGISASRIIISVRQHPKMKRHVRTGFFIIRGDDEEFEDSKGYFCNCDQELGGCYTARKLTGTGRGIGVLFADELAFEERAF